MTDRGEIRSLTGLRGVAACFVMAYHFFQSNTGTGPGRTMILHGYLSVDLFFVLSGFVIAMIYGAKFAGGFSPGAYGGFLVRRVGRVYPLYIAMTAFIIVGRMLGWFDNSPVSVMTLVSNASMTQAWGLAESINGTTWSISTEFAAYLLFPVIALVILRGSMVVAWLAMIAAATVLLVIAQQSSLALHQIYDGAASRNGPLDVFGTGTIFPLARCLAGFCLGVAAFRFKSQVGADFGRAADPLAIALLGCLAVRGADVGTVLLCAPLVIALAASDRSITARFLAAPLVYWLGLVSYSIYLTHRLIDDLAFYPLFGVFQRVGVPHAFSLARVVVIGVVLIVSAMTYYAIETPARDAVRHAFSRRRRVVAA